MTPGFPGLARPATFPRRTGLVSPARAIPARIALLAMMALACGCSNHALGATDARKLIESSDRFSAPDVLTVRSRYCSTIDAPADNPASGLGRLKALQDTGAIRLDHRAAAPGECPATPGPMREWLIISLTEIGDRFHPHPLPDGAGWEFTRAQRRFLSLGELTFNSEGDPTIAHATYRWAWKAELLGQLLQVSEDPVNAQATFIRRDSNWELRDVGF
jgi:hypothetical protein